MNSQGQDPYKRGSMGSLGGSVAQSVESRGVVSGPSIRQFLNSAGGSASSGSSTNTGGTSVSSSANTSSGVGVGSPAAVLSAVAASHANSLLMANSIPAPQQRAVNDMIRQMQGLGQHAFLDRSRNLSGFMGRSYGTSGGGGTSVIGLHSNFGASDSAPPPLDLSEFPSLSSRNTDSSQPNPMAGRQPYGMWEKIGMVKQPTAETSEFTMSSEDFPALPGSQNNSAAKAWSWRNQENLMMTPSIAGDAFSSGDKKVSSSSGSDTPTDMSLRPGDKTQSHKRGIQTSPDGKVTNIPAGMVTDQFGMVGLLTFIRAAETDNNLVSLALGSDLTTLGLNLNSPENLYPNFGGPWAETPCRPQDIDYHVPQEYLTNQQIRGNLAPVKFDRYGEDLLFYMFYSNAGDLLQIMAAAELYTRDWRYHKEERVWITRAPGMAPVDKGPTYERGTYFYFDAQNWRKVPKEFHLEYDKLEERPHIPNLSNHSHTPTSSTL